MATGIPSKFNRTDLLRNGNRIPFRLEYDGKVAVEEIFNISSAQLICVISVEKKPRNRLIYGENLRVLRSLLDDIHRCTVL